MSLGWVVADSFVGWMTVGIYIWRTHVQPGVFIPQCVSFSVVVFITVYYVEK